MFKPFLQNETLQKGVYLTHFSSVNTNQSHKNVTQTIHASLLFPIIVIITANSGYLYASLFLLSAGSPFCSCRRVCKASLADTKKILWVASSCVVHAFNSVTRNSTPRPMCCFRTYKNTFKHNYYTNTKLMTFGCNLLKENVTLLAHTCSINSFSTDIILIYYQHTWQESQFLRGKLELCYISRTY